MPTEEEDAEIQRGIDADPDAHVPTDVEFARMKPRDWLKTHSPG